MSEEDLIEQTEVSRYRKLALCIIALVGIHYTQMKVSMEITWPIVVVDSIVVLSYVADDVLLKIVRSEAVTKMRDAVIDRIPSSKEKSK